MIEIQDYFLDSDEYIKSSTSKEYLLIHFTAGSNNPKAVVDAWNSDTRGRIGTEFVLGGLSLKGDSTWDGKIIRCIPNDCWAYHIGDNGNPRYHPYSVGIEICNYGPLTFDQASGKYLTYVKSVVPESMVCKLSRPFRGYSFYHAYTEKQLSSLKELIYFIADKHKGIDITKGLPEWLKTEYPDVAFDYKSDAYYGRVKGIIAHSNIRKDKFDGYPHPQLIELFKSL